MLWGGFPNCCALRRLGRRCSGTWLAGASARRMGITSRTRIMPASCSSCTTLGVHGGYTQRDVMEVARCLTGWNVRSVKQFHKGRVEFRRELHDDGPKLVLGQTIPAGLGEQDLDRVLGIVSLHPA